MRDIFEKHIDWDILEKENLTKEDFAFEIKDGVIRKSTGVLTIELALNFVIPVYSERKIKGIILNAIPEVKDVEIKCQYENMIQSPKTYLELYLPKMIDRANGLYRGITESIIREGLEVENNTLYIKALGNVMTERLNESLSDLFKKYIRDDFGIDMKVVFVNDQELHHLAKENLEKEVEVRLEEAIKESAEQSKQAAEKVKETPVEKKSQSASGIKRRNEYLAKRRQKELPVIGNIIMGGRAIVGDEMPISEIDPTMKDAVTGGIVFGKEMKVFSSGSIMAKLFITDKSKSVLCKTFVTDEKWKDIDENISLGDYVKIQGQPQIDQYEDNSLTIAMNRIEKGQVKKREDNYPGLHRVELHCHTKMSRMDGLNDVKTIINTAVEWNQPAVAITDHGVVQSFPDAGKLKDDLKKKGKEIKIIYGMEGYVFNDSGSMTEEDVLDYKSRNTYHIILLAATQEGIKNLYRLVSESHINYFYKRPRLPKSLIEKYREGLIIGSACEAGEVYRAIVDGVSDEELDKVASFYDYLEIQPLINNRFMIERGIVDSNEDLREYNRRIIRCGDRLGKLVCATTDAHYDEPESAVYRNVILGSMGFDNAENGQGLYLRTTEEMMEEFSYLGEELAHKVVVENPNLIAEMIDENIKPIPDGKFPPVIENSDEILRSSCMNRAKEIYGDPLPDIIADRLKVELDSIISNKYSVMYVSAQMLINKSMEAGYMVGSRGSVGSSLAATFAGITEVNPLEPHYVCPQCKYIEWGDRELYDCGIDLPEKDCPHCGAPLKRDGFTIPFATFLGFEGDKEPDIDLNFAGEFQATAHRYVGEIFGEKNVFKAGTVSTLKRKNAERIVSKFTEETGINYDKLDATRIAMGCEGVKNTTGQHPGGIIIVPDDHEIYEFCPIQHPANKDVDIVTTHFDYHKLENNLLKLDILGHTGPSMFRHLYDMTGINPMHVDIADRKVISIFNSTEALNIVDPEYRYTDGTFGVPEFGTHFVRGMLQEIKPQKIGDLVRIAGFSHGTDVWTNNAQDYVNQGIASMNEVISTRDDIMNYLILKGLENKDAFDIMEDVRKNRPLKEHHLKMMKDAGVPDWYIESCKKIQYMFPRAHAAAYVMTSLRVAWYKVYYPLEFYAAHFTASADAFESAIILRGQGACDEAVRRIMSRGDNFADYERKEKDEKTRPIFEIAYEMYARGYRFRAPELGKSQALRFTVDNGEVLLPFVALEGVGESAAKALYAAYEEKPFSTVEEITSRVKINKTALEALRSYGVLAGLPETDQISFF